MSTAITVSPGTGIVHLPNPFPLRHGGELRSAHLAFEAFGDPANPTVVVLGGISAGRHVTADGSVTAPPWWAEAVGPGRAVDTNRYHVLGIDYLGGSGASTSPANTSFDGGFPSIDTVDQARAITTLLDRLGVERAHACVGASYGGMVGLALAAEFAERVERLVVLCAAHESHPMATALRAIQRNIVRFGLEYGSGSDAVRLARGVAMTTYRTAEEFAARFDNTPRPATAVGSRGPRFLFDVEGYLDHHGRRFASLYSPESFLALCESLDLHRIDPASVRAPTTLIGFEPDALVPPWQVRDLAGRLGAPCRLEVIETDFGHDAFLKEIPVFEPIVRRALAGEREV